jgi:NAD(P)H-quinone oxidoreductase subunit 5
MFDTEQILQVLALVVVVSPAVMLAVIGLPALVGWPLGEAPTGRVALTSVTVALVAAVGVFVLMLATGDRHVALDFGSWVSIGDHDTTGTKAHTPHYHFDVKFVFDRLSVAFLMLALVLCGAVGHFSIKYLHRENGFGRFFILFAVFVLGMVIATLSGTIETLFSGWELVGLSSALLVAFFHERPAPVRNGLWVWGVYRTTDVSLVLAAVAMYSVTGGGDFDRILGGEDWPYERTALTEGQALLIGLLLLGAAVGKSALVPLSGWLPRAMEGPTPSSAVFYGALSVHFGAFLLLRANALLAASVTLAVVVIAVGLTTAIFAYLAGAVQTDIKSALAYASLAQVGIIVAEIGLGRWEPFLWYVALVHLLGHACLRTLQFLRAPTLLQDYRHLENAIGSRLNHGAAVWLRALPPRYRAWLYRFALERGYLDQLIVRFVIRPYVAVFTWFDAAERRLTARLNGERPPTAPIAAAPLPASAAATSAGAAVPEPVPSAAAPTHQPPADPAPAGTVPSNPTERPA